jgi:hypothetical protein
MSELHCVQVVRFVLFWPALRDRVEMPDPNANELTRAGHAFAPEGSTKYPGVEVTRENRTTGEQGVEHVYPSCQHRRGPHAPVSHGLVVEMQARPFGVADKRRERPD